MTKTFRQQLYKLTHGNASHLVTMDELELCENLNTIIWKLVEFEREFPGGLPPELFDFIDVIKMGARKYTVNNWLEPSGKRCSRKEMSDSMFHHLSDYFAGKEADNESGQDPLLHLQTRSGMAHVRKVRKIKHPEDK